MSKTNNKAQLYTLPLKRAMNMMTDAERSMKMYAESIKTFAGKYAIEDWHSSPISDYMDAYLNAKVLRDFIQRSIEDPDEAIKDYLKKNTIDGLLVTRDQLTMLYTLSTNFEQSKDHMNKTYGFSTLLN